MPEFLHCPAVLALELAPDVRLPRRDLDRAQAARCASLLADDLHRLLPGTEAAHLAVAGALYDTAQLLRPGFPVFAALAELAERGVGDATQAQIIAFGSHEGAMPVPDLAPLAELGAGPMLLLPWSAFGPPDVIDALGTRMEQEFLARGEASAELADTLMRSLGVRLEHARYLTRHDLCALTCVQLEHAGFSAAWDMLEAALLAPRSTQDSYSSRGRSWHYANGVAHTASPGYAAWLATMGASVERDGRAHAWAGSLFELRQFLALFAAHAVAVNVDEAEHAGGGVIETLAPIDADLPAPQLLAHEAPGLGVVAISVVQTTATQGRVLANAYPLAADALDALRDLLAARYACTEPMQRLGRIVLDADATALSAPTQRAH